VAVPAYDTVAGPSCHNAGATFSETGFFNGGTGNAAVDWISTPAGGYAADGCSGAFDSMPLSGKPTAYDSNRYAVWTFSPGTAYKNASCSVAVYVPKGGSLTTVGGAPAHYLYYGAPADSTPAPAPLGSFTVNQVTNPDKWVPGPTFVAANGVVSVRLVDAGVNAAPAAGAREAVAQVRLTCQAAG
jgi:hypothetical protein